jgi:hypothetical protein
VGIGVDRKVDVVHWTNIQWSLLETLIGVVVDEYDHDSIDLKFGRVFRPVDPGLIQLQRLKPSRPCNWPCTDANRYDYEA